LIAEAELAFVCCSLNASSRELFGAALLERMREDVVLTSVSPNGVFDVDAVAAAFAARPRAHATLDLDCIDPSHPLLRLANVTVTPHVAFLTEESLARRFDGCIDALHGFLRRTPISYISPHVSGAVPAAAARA
ncbi:MAG TPA: NAD(P)-dependent oxidoreductase, partial [Dongiaceae bacterium]|nr:NAD(P)-dependent oxidoreductase [Dongiaceae bacterium]